MRIIAGEARGRRLVAPRGRGTRPALDQLRESVFSILGEAVEDRAVLDLFAGSGAFGLEALSRGARAATFVENDPAALQALEHNLTELGFGARARVIRGDALRWPAGEEAFGLVFLDPPFALFDEPWGLPAIRERIADLLARSIEPGGRLLFRHPAERSIDVGRPPADRRTFGASTVFFFESP